MQKSAGEKLVFEKKMGKASTNNDQRMNSKAMFNHENVQPLQFEMDYADTHDHLARSDSAGEQASSSSPVSAAFHFFQSEDGDVVFLHFLSYKPILAQAEQNVNLLPRKITATVLEVEELKVTNATRQKLPFISHLPTHCSIMLVEIDLTDLVSPVVMKPFMDEINKRAKLRKKKENKKAAERKDDLAEKLQHEMFVQDMKERWRLKCERERETINELLTGPTPGEVHTTVFNDGNDVNNQQTDGHGNLIGDHAFQSSPSNDAWTNHSSQAISTPSNWSFAKITASGYYPTLSEAAKDNKNGDNNQLGTSPLSQSPSTLTVLETGIWGTRKTNASSSPPVWSTLASHSSGSASSNGSGSESRSRSGSGSGSGSGTKSKGTPLFSNAGGRSYR